jgi:hypothetical protein
MIDDSPEGIRQYLERADAPFATMWGLWVLSQDGGLIGFWWHPNRAAMDNKAQLVRSECEPLSTPMCSPLRYVVREFKATGPAEELGLPVRERPVPKTTRDESELVLPFRPGEP